MLSSLSLICDVPDDLSDKRENAINIFCKKDATTCDLLSLMFWYASLSKIINTAKEHSEESRQHSNDSFIVDK